MVVFEYREKTAQRTVDLVDLALAELAQNALATRLVRVGRFVADADALAGESHEQGAAIVGIGQSLDERVDRTALPVWLAIENTSAANAPSTRPYDWLARPLETYDPEDQWRSTSTA